jgi:3-hydroxyacyl-CoA dehydrogenase
MALEVIVMSSSPFIVRKAAVLGAGVMGAQIAAHLVNAKVPAILFELPAKSGDPNGNVVKAIDNLRKLEPSPLAVRANADLIEPANYDQHLGLLAECDLVIEAISERMDLKRDLYAKVAAHIGSRAIFASNTSGLSIDELARALPEALQPRFCGVHFFNPPRYMHLVELIPCSVSAADRLDELERFLVTILGKGVIRAKDTPNFIANRVGFFSLLATLHHAERLKLGFDVVDDLTGTRLGRPRSATLRTLDVVGLDTFAHVVNTMAQGLPDDPWHRHYAVPGWLQKLIDAGALGQKTGRGVYRKVGDSIEVLDLARGDYRPSTGKADEEITDILKLADPAEKLAKL